MEGVYGGLGSFTFDSQMAASHVRITGVAGTVLTGGATTLFAIVRGAPKIELISLTFEQSGASAVIALSEAHVGRRQLGGSSSFAASAGQGPELYMENCTFLHNSGSALLLNAGTIRIKASAFSDNGSPAVQGGGAIRAIHGHLFIDGSAFRRNVAWNGGAIHADGAVEGWVMNCIFSNNSAVNLGGAINLEGGDFVVGNQTNIYGNRAAAGRSLYLSINASASYVLPAPAGHWIANTIRCTRATEQTSQGCRPQLSDRSLFDMLPGPLNDGQCL